MTNSNSSETTLAPIDQENIPEVAKFLHENMNSQFSIDTWIKGINKNWIDDAPNFGFMLTQKNKIVGVLCAIYSKQYVNGSLEKFCNPHTWCVLPEFRKRSVDLVLTVIKQTGYHFTMFSPNAEGIVIFSYLRFKPLDDTITIMPNTPTIKTNKNVKIIKNLDDGMKLLTPEAGMYLKDHMPYPWLNFLVFGDEKDYGFIIYKKNKFKRLDSAQIIYISNYDLFKTCWPSLKNELLFKQGFFTTKIESRLLKSHLKSKSWKEPGLKKFYLSPTLAEENVENVYSELVTLDI